MLQSDCYQKCQNWERFGYQGCQNKMWHPGLMISTLAVDLVVKNTHWEWSPISEASCVHVLNHSIISILSKFPDLICLPVMTLRNSHKKPYIVWINEGVYLKVTQLPLYTLSLRAPPFDRLSNTPIDKWEMAWTTEKKKQNFSVFFLTEFCVKVPATRCSGSVCARGGVLTSSYQRWSL